MGLADKIIEANQKPKEEPKDSKYFVDDLGIPIKKDYRKDYRVYTEYLTARIFMLNEGLNKRDDLLFNHNEIVQPTAETIALLARYSEPIPRSLVVNVHRRVWELAPRLNPDIIVVAKGLGWDLTKGEFVKMDPNAKVI